MKCFMGKNIYIVFKFKREYSFDLIEEEITDVFITYFSIFYNNKEFNFKFNEYDDLQKLSDNCIKAILPINKDA